MKVTPLFVIEGAWIEYAQKDEMKPGTYEAHCYPMKEGGLKTGFHPYVLSEEGTWTCNGGFTEASSFLFPMRKIG